jgi:hypothetical protein
MFDYFYGKEINISDIEKKDDKNILKIINSNFYDKQEKIDFTFNLLKKKYKNQNVIEKEKYFFYADKFWSKIILNENISKNFNEMGYYSRKNLNSYKNENLVFTKPIEEVLILEFYLLKLITQNDTFVKWIINFFRNLFE